jgi:hypothetical protein
MTFHGWIWSTWKSNYTSSFILIKVNNISHAKDNIDSHTKLILFVITFKCLTWAIFNSFNIIKNCIYVMLLAQSCPYKSALYHNLIGFELRDSQFTM